MRQVGSAWSMQWMTTTASAGARAPETLLDESRWQRPLAELLGEVRSPGAVFALLVGDEQVVCAAGTANLDTGVPVTVDTLFPVASVTKVYTATLVLQLVDDGLLDLDAPLRTYLPDFRVADPEVSERVTARHLLTHTSGIGGDKADAYGRGDDAVERYVESCATLPQAHPLGATLSYANSGYVILGRLVEVLRDTTWDDAIRERILEPLGANRSGTLPDDLIWLPVAAPHQTGDDKQPHVLYAWEIHRAMGPAGGVVTTAGDLLRFVRMHLDGGAAGDNRVLSSDSAAAMRAAQVKVPDASYGATHWGLGWELLAQEGQPLLFGHGGDNDGHHTRLLICPDARFAALLLVNGDGADRISEPMFREAFGEIGVTLPEPVRPPAEPPEVDVARFAGTYESIAVRATFTPVGDRLEGHFRVISESLAELLPESQRERRLTFLPVGGSQFVTRDDDGDPWASAIFYEADGRRYLHMGLRAMPEA
jgi:CubicO group peptidase (beta-lactamase class C family)